MKAHKKRVRTLRGLAIAGSLAALALPSAAGAMPLRGDPPSPLDRAPTVKTDIPAVVHASKAGAYVMSPGFKTDAHYTLPSNFKTDVPAVVHASKAGAYVMSPGFKTDAQNHPSKLTPQFRPFSAAAAAATARGYAEHSQQSPSAAPQSPSSGGDDETLALALASAAFAITLCGAAYASSRTTRVQRRLADSAS